MRKRPQEEYADNPILNLRGESWELLTDSNETSHHLHAGEKNISIDPV